MVRKVAKASTRRSGIGRSTRFTPLRTYAKSNQLPGFTLVELLVSIVIIGIVLSIAVLSLSLVDNDREIRREAQRLMAIIDIAKDDAVLQGREFGIEFTVSGYRFVEYDPFSTTWLEVPGDDLLRLRALPEDVELDLFLEEKQVSLEEEPAELFAEDDSDPSPTARNYAPHVMILSSGDMTPFELHINRLTDDVMIAMQADILGNLKLLTEDERQF